MVRSGSARACAALAAAVAVSAAALLTASPASAQLSATLDDLALPTVPYSHQEQTVTGRVVLTASDTSEGMVDLLTGLLSESDGWHVTERVSDLQYRGLHNGSAIPAANLSIVGLDVPVASSGSEDEVDPAGGPKIPATPLPASLDTARIVLEAEPGHGRGTYTQGITLSLTVPAGTRAGTYTGTITTTIVAGPAA